MKTAVIIGAGPAGLTAAYELLKQTDIKPIVLEAEDFLGGISRTVNNSGNRMDIGGHRFFSKDPSIMAWWTGILPLQGVPAPDPDKEDRVMLVRNRISRIRFRRTFFDYPISLKWSTFKGMGLANTLKAGFGYIGAKIRPLPETSLENFYINRFGRPLYEMFFEDYTTKVWGVHPSRIGADWGAQRVKGLSVFAVIKDALMRPFRSKASAKVETSLIEQFIYPKYGPGQLWETVAAEVEKMGGSIFKETKVTAVNVEDGKVTGVSVMSPDGERTIACDWLLSSMPLKELVEGLRGLNVPQEAAQAAQGLPYRDFMTAGVLLRRLSLPHVPDTWIYVQEKDVKVGRLQIFNNWSPYMVADPENTVYVGMEYFCNEGDELWNMAPEAFESMAVAELEKIGMASAADVLKTSSTKVKKAYPAYFGTYGQIGSVREFLDTIPNLFCIGRNGQHRYNNMDHSMLTAMEAVKNIKEGSSSKHNVWNVNTEQSYHESK